MAIRHACPHCRAKMKAPDHYAGRRIRCPNCTIELTLPASEPAEEIIDAEIVEPTPPPTPNPWEIQFLDDLHEPDEVVEFLEPPITPLPAAPRQRSAQPTENRGVWLRRMFEAALEPRSIYWLLTIGGGLMILGAIIWLISRGVLDNPFIMACMLGASSVSVLVGGWLVTLKTRFKIAGRALTFFGCVVLPLNLWFYDSQDLLILENGLWLGGVVCLVFYVATVWILRDPLFMYAVEAGITLTAVLLLGNYGQATSATQLSILLTALGLLSIHAQLVFPKDRPTFSAERFGMPLFWCGHGQLGFALLLLLGTQTGNWMIDQLNNVFNIPVNGIPLTSTAWLPSLLWLAGAYAYLFSDFVVRRVGIYMYLAAVCLVMCEITLIGFDVLGIEGLIAALAITATGISVLSILVPPEEERFARAIPPLALILSLLPLILGLVLHLRSTSIVASELELKYEAGWYFVAVMFGVAVLNRISAFVYQQRSNTLAAVYLFFSAGALVVAAAAVLRVLEVVTWYEQLPWLMLLPIGYIIAARLWRGRSPEQPLGWIAHAATAILLAHALIGALAMLARGFDQSVHLYLTLLAAEATIFYVLAAIFRRKSANIYFAAIAGCGAAWQLMLYLSLPQDLFTTVFALGGLAVLVAGRQFGWETNEVYDAAGNLRNVKRGRGLHVMHVGHAILSLAILVSVAKGIMSLIAVGLTNDVLSNYDWIALGVVTLASAAAAFVSPREGHWRPGYILATVLLAGLAFISLTVAIDLSIWRKLEIFVIGSGLIMLGAGYVGRFREVEAEQSELTTFGLWLGSILASLPAIIAVFYQWNTATAFSPTDEIVLLSVTLLMLATGVVWQVQASTFFGGGTLFTYLVVLVISLVYRRDVDVVVYVILGGAILFGLGIFLALYRDRLLSLPQRMAERQGIFRVIGWR